MLVRPTTQLAATPNCLLNYLVNLYRGRTTELFTGNLKQPSGGAFHFVDWKAREQEMLMAESYQPAAFDHHMLIGPVWTCGWLTRSSPKADREPHMAFRIVHQPTCHGDGSSPPGTSLWCIRSKHCSCYGAAKTRKRWQMRKKQVNTCRSSTEDVLCVCVDSPFSYPMFCLCSFCHTGLDRASANHLIWCITTCRDIEKTLNPELWPRLAGERKKLFMNWQRAKGWDTCRHQKRGRDRLVKRLREQLGAKRRKVKMVWQFSLRTRCHRRIWRPVVPTDQSANQSWK